MCVYVYIYIYAYVYMFIHIYAYTFNNWLNSFDIDISLDGIDPIGKYTLEACAKYMGWLLDLS